MDEPMCLTCGFMWEDEMSEDLAEDLHRLHDSAHYATWSHYPSEELDILVSLQDTGRRPCQECRRCTGHKMDCTKGRS